MRIRSVRTRVEDFGLLRPYTIAFRTVEHVSNVVVELETEDGTVGFGTGSPEPFVTGETMDDAASALASDACAWLVGEDVRELPRLLRSVEARLHETPAAAAAVDIALHDLFAKHLGVPLVDALGRAHHALPTSITIGIKPQDEALAEAEEYLGRGFRVLKIKLGHDLDEDIERLAVLREAVGPDVLLRVDPNQGYDAEDVVAFARRTEAIGIEFLEQPMEVGAAAEAAVRELPEEVRRTLAADESLQTPADALRLIQPPRACGIFNIKLMKCGGVGPGRRIADIADTAGIELMWGCMDESRVSIAAALHAALASPATRYLDLDGSLDLARDIVEGGFTLTDGRLAVTDAPGLGVTPLA